MEENTQIPGDMFPFETIDLPSKGLLYPKTNPLSSGRIEIMIPTAKHEDILTNQNFIQKGVVIDKFLQAVIKSPIDYNDLVTGDKDAIMMASRMLAYGPEYTVNITCPKCGEKESDYSINLNELEFKTTELNNQNVNEFSFVLPHSKTSITFKSLTIGDEKRIEEELTYLKKISKDVPELSTRLKYVITSVNGDKDNKKIREFVDKQLTSRDSLELRKHMITVIPGVDMKHIFKCKECEAESVMSIPMSIQFFWPHAGI